MANRYPSLAHLTPEQRLERRREQKRAATRRWEERHPEQHAEAHRARTRARYQRYRSEVIDLLGRRCATCGFDELDILQIDHVNGGGSAHRKSKTGFSWLTQIIKEVRGGSMDYQLLCPNCHARKSLGEHGRRR